MVVLFQTPRLAVRQVTPDDVDAVLSIFGDPENVREYGTGQPWSRAEAERSIASYPTADPRLVCAPGLALLKLTWAIGGFGGVGYYVWEGNTADLLFALRREHWGNGLATELAIGAIAAAFQRPEVERIHATVKPTNLASIRVLEKSGMRRHGYRADTDRMLFILDRAAWRIDNGM